MSPPLWQNGVMKNEPCGESRWAFLGLLVKVPPIPAIALAACTPAAAAPEQAEAQAEIRFCDDFLYERDEILELKWIESEKVGSDIGYKKAIQLWLKHRPGWKAAHPPAAG